MQVHFDTYREDAPVEYINRKGVAVSYTGHSVEITIGNDRRRVSCGEVYDGRLYIHSLAVRFSQGAKVWPGTAVYWIEKGTVGNVLPNIDKRGHFQLAGYFDDFQAKAVASQHNAVA
jgi:hypothetical protein